ncbi:MAG: sigma-70 family RNA polymerase sigma factor [Clostridia bacterium]|nr:sigma-70 family RNA polymerase sigma factor [Clostridia bacterium]
MNINTIKKDLRQLKKTIHIIEALKCVQERYQQRIETLSRLALTDKVKEQIRTTKRIMGLMSIEEYIKEATEIEAKYMSAINQLDPLDKAIVLDNLVNGIPYWKIGLKLGYTEDGIKKRINKAIRKLSSIMQ